MSAEAVAQQSTAPRRPGGRSERVRAAVVEAVRALILEQGPDFAIGLVAARAGVDRSTVYRRWPLRADLVREALTLHTRGLELPETREWRGYLRELSVRLREFSFDPFELSLNAMLVSNPNSELSRTVLASWEPVMSALRAPLEHAIARGELRSDANAEILLEMLWAPIVIRSLIAPDALTHEFVTELAENVIRAAADPAAHTSPAGEGSHAR